MRAQIVIVHDDPVFLERSVAVLKRKGYDIAAFSDAMVALNALERAERVEVLVTDVHVTPNKPHGISLAQMARLRRPKMRVLFIAEPGFSEHTRGLGEFLAMPVDVPTVVNVIEQLLTA